MLPLPLAACMAVTGQLYFNGIMCMYVNMLINTTNVKEKKSCASA
jgi:hypothetical protein